MFKCSIKSQVTDVVCSHAAFTSLILPPIFAHSSAHACSSFEVDRPIQLIQPMKVFFLNVKCIFEVV